MQRSYIWGKKIPLIWRRLHSCKAWKYRFWGIFIGENSGWTIVHQEETLIRKIATLVSNQRREKWANCQLNTVLSCIPAWEVCSRQKVISSHLTGYLGLPAAWRMRKGQFQNQVSWYITTSLKLPEILYWKRAEVNISICESPPSWSNRARPHV